MTPALQGWIHRFEEGSGVRIVKAVALGIAVLGLALTFNLRNFKNFSAPEAMDQAQLARNIAEGRGFTTEFIRPLSLFLLRQKGGDMRLKEAQPDISNPPVYPWLLAGLMHVVSFDYTVPGAKTFRTFQPEIIIAWFNEFWFLVMLGLAFWLAKRLFDEFVAWITVLLLAGTNLLWQFNISGLSTNVLLVIALIVSHLVISVEEGGRERAWSPAKLTLFALIAGIVIGLGCLTRYSFGWLFFPAVIYLGIFADRSRFLVCLALAAGFVAVTSPWLSRNHQLSGKLFGTAQLAVHAESDRFTGNRLERALLPVNPATPADLNKVEVDEYWQKLGPNLARIIQNDLPKFGGSWAAAFCFASLFLRLKNPALARFRIFLLLSLITMAMVQALGKTWLTSISPEINSENLLIIFAPAAYVFAAGTFAILLDGMEVTFPPMRRFISGIFVAIVSLPLLFAIWSPTSPFAYPPYYPPVIHDDAGFLAEKELMMSDVPWAVAWYGRRPCVWLTWDLGSDYQEIHRQRAIHALYLTTLTMDQKFVPQLLGGDDWAWGQFAVDAVVKEEIPTGFPLKYARIEGFPYHLFLADQQRWNQPIHK
jgi:4-amino-4-deoxy-L-arabinose transferase-like glycosyltransferase